MDASSVSISQRILLTPQQTFDAFNKGTRDDKLMLKYDLLGSHGQCCDLLRRMQKAGLEDANCIYQSCTGDRKIGTITGLLLHLRDSSQNPDGLLVGYVAACRLFEEQVNEHGSAQLDEAKEPIRVKEDGEALESGKPMCMVELHTPDDFIKFDEQSGFKIARMMWINGMLSTEWMMV